MWFVFLTAIVLVLLLSILLFSLVSLLIATLSGAPYVPARSDRIRTLIELIQPKPGMRIADLGSGDGRVVRALASGGAIVDGYEIQPLLVLWSKATSWLKRLPTTAYYRQNLFMVDLCRYDVVVIYGLPIMMERLSKKFEAELRPGAQVVSIAFPIPAWNEVEKRNGVFVYKVKKGGME